MPCRRVSPTFEKKPAFVLDPIYRLVARVRYRIWGKTDACELPAPDERALFLA